MNLKQIIESAIPLTMDCEVKRKEELIRRAKLRIDIEALLRDKHTPYSPDMEYKGSSLNIVKEEV